MKRYTKYMDTIKASDTLNQRLKELKAPKKQPAAWAKYGAVAAAFILVFCGAALGMHWDARWSGRLDDLFRQAVYVPEDADVPQPDIAVVEPGDVAQPGEKTLGGYEVTGGGVTAHYVLPDIEYTQAGNPNRYTVAADWDLPQGALRRDMSREHIAYLLGGEDALSTHLDWDGYELSGWAAWYENGDFWGAYINGYAGELDHFTFAVTAGQLPPTCFEFPDIEEQDVCGVMVSAVGYDSTASTRLVSFMKDGYGYRFDLTGTDRELAEARVSRLVRLVADDGTRYLEWATDSMGPVTVVNEDGTFTCQICGETFPKGTVHTESGLNLPGSSVGLSIICPRCGRTFSSYDSFHAHVHSFPGAGDSSAPAVSADPSYTCPTCGETVPAGMSHDCAMCDGYPAPHICEICGEAYPEGAAHSHEACGYPLAPDTHVCEVCGQTLPEGVEHSHLEDHHQDHGSNHH